MTDTTSALVAVARLGLGATPDTRPVVPEPGVADELVAAIVEHGVVGMAARALEAGMLAMPDGAARHLVAAHDAAMARTLTVEARMIDVVDVLEAADVEYRLLGGSALAYLIAPDPADREFGEVDVLVRSHDVTRAVEELQASGARRLRPPPSDDFDRRFAESVSLRWSGVDVDIHRTFAAGPFGVWSTPDDVFVLPSRFAVADRTLATLDRTDHLLHACYQVALSPSLPPLAILRDIALLSAGDWDDNRLRQTVERWQGRAVVARAVRLVEGLLETHVREELARFTPEPGDGGLLGPYRDAGDRSSALAMATLRALPARDRAAFARALALPAGSDPRRRIMDLWSSRPRR